MYQKLHPVTYYFYPLFENDLAETSDKDRLVNILQGPNTQARDNLLYIHIPFCHELCRFCPFHVKVHTPDQVYRRYTQALITEMALLSSQPYVKEKVFSAVYFGGGSPSILSDDLLEDLFQAFFRYFNIAPDAEITFEGEPRTLGEPNKLDLLKRHGVTRISFGLQTYLPQIRELFQIAATLDDIDQVTRNARERGFQDINVDMMYDLPGQTVADLEYDLRHLKAHDFDSVDYYNLHYYAFPKKMKLAFADGSLPSKPSMEMHQTLNAEIIRAMAELQYHHVADQIFAKYPAPCTYFRLLWGGGNGDYRAETLAVGASARGYLSGLCYMNEPSANLYMTRVEEGQLPIQKVSSSLVDPRNRGVAFFPKFFQLDKAHESVLETLRPGLLDQWLAAGYIKRNQSGLSFTETGKLWTTNMMVDTFEPHQASLAHQSTSSLEEKAGTRTGSF